MIKINSFVLFLCSVIQFNSLAQSQEDPSVTPKPQSKEEVYYEDVKKISNDTGYPVDKIKESMDFQKKFSKYTEILELQYPGEVSAFWHEALPVNRGTIRFVDSIPTKVSEELSQGNLFIVGAISLLGNGQYSRESHIKRARIFTDALIEAGYTPASLGFDMVINKFKVKFRPTKDNQKQKKEKLLRAINDKRKKLNSKTNKVLFKDRDVSDAELEVGTVEGMAEFTTGNHTIKADSLLGLPEK